MTLDTITHHLDAHEQRVVSGDTFDAVNSVSAAMFALRMRTNDEHWKSVCKPFIESHNLFHLLQQDPYTRRAKEKPRGYAGDAVMLDFLYFRTPPEETTLLGREIFNCTVASPGADAVRWRARHFAQRIDDLNRAGNVPRCLSLACGHLREAEFSEAIRSNQASIVAVDQDPQSLSTVSTSYGAMHVDAQLCNVRDVIKGKATFGDLHLAYAAGLYDYLPQSAATALTARLFSMLVPGGSVVVPNFLHTNPVRGYMESFMDWFLNVRTPEEIHQLGTAISDAQVAAKRYYEDPFGVVGYLEITKGG